MIDQLKPNHNYIIYRIVFVIFLSAWLIGGSYDLWHLSKAQIITVSSPEFISTGPNYFPKYIIFLLPFMLVSLFMFFNLCAFPLKYSIFGSYRRSPLPNVKPQIERRVGFSEE